METIAPPVRFASLKAPQLEALPLCYPNRKVDASFAALGVLGSVVSGLSSIHHNEFLYKYGNDFSLPFMAYFGLRALLPRNERLVGRLSPFAGFAVCVAGEIAQQQGYLIKPSIIDSGGGGYDPYDYCAYALGTLSAYAVDRFLNRKVK